MKLRLSCMERQNFRSWNTIQQTSKSKLSYDKIFQPKLITMSPVKIVLKTMNDTMGKDGLVFWRPVFGMLPRFSVLITNLPKQKEPASKKNFLIRNKLHCRWEKTIGSTEEKLHLVQINFTTQMKMFWSVLRKNKGMHWSTQSNACRQQEGNCGKPKRFGSYNLQQFSCESFL